MVSIYQLNNFKEMYFLCIDLSKVPKIQSVPLTNTHMQQPLLRPKVHVKYAIWDRQGL